MQLFELRCRELLASYLCSLSAGRIPNNNIQPFERVVKRFLLA